MMTVQEMAGQLVKCLEAAGFERKALAELMTEGATVVGMGAEQLDSLLRKRQGSFVVQPLGAEYYLVFGRLKDSLDGADDEGPRSRSGGKYELFDLSGLRQKNRDIRSEQSRRSRKGVWDSRDFENAAGCGDRQTCRRGADRGLRYAVVEGSIYGDRKSVKRLSRLKKRAAAVYGAAK